MAIIALFSDIYSKDMTEKCKLCAEEKCVCKSTSQGKKLNCMLLFGKVNITHSRVYDNLASALFTAAAHSLIGTIFQLHLVYRNVSFTTVQ